MDISKLKEEYKALKEKEKEKLKRHKECQRNYKETAEFRKREVARLTQKYHSKLSRMNAEAQAGEVEKYMESKSQFEKAQAKGRKSQASRAAMEKATIRENLKDLDKREKRTAAQKARMSGKRHGYYTLRLVRDFRQVGSGIRFTEKRKAYEAYREKVEENKSSVWCPAVREAVGKDGSTTVSSPLGYEILLTRSDTSMTSESENVRGFPNEYGKIEYVRADNGSLIIMEKAPWLMEDTFHVFGFHPKYERKTAPWIGENLIAEGLSAISPRRIFCFGRYLIVDSALDFTFVRCRSELECTRLYGVLFKRYEKKGHLYFTGDLNPHFHGAWEEKILEKTGWREI